MKVSELIEELGKVPPDMDVVLYDSLNEGHADPSQVEIVNNEAEEAYDKCDAPSRLGQTFPYVRIS